MSVGSELVPEIAPLVLGGSFSSIQFRPPKA
jgi:hypothetical protein